MVFRSITMSKHAFLKCVKMGQVEAQIPFTVLIKEVIDIHMLSMLTK